MSRNRATNLKSQNYRCHKTGLVIDICGKGNHLGLKYYPGYNLSDKTKQKVTISYSLLHLNLHTTCISQFHNTNEYFLKHYMQQHSNPRHHTQNQINLTY